MALKFQEKFEWLESKTFFSLTSDAGALQIIQNKQDTLSWAASKDESFFISNCYSLLMKQGDQWDDNRPWKSIWKTTPVKEDSYCAIDTIYVRMTKKQ